MTKEINLGGIKFFTTEGRGRDNTIDICLVILSVLESKKTDRDQHEQ